MPGLFAVALLCALLLTAGVRAIYAANAVVAVALLVVFLAALDVSPERSIARNAPLALLALLEIGVIGAAIAGLRRLSWAAFFAHGAVLIPLALLIGLFAGNSIF